MSSRVGFRSRPLEQTKQLQIIKDRTELDPPGEGGNDVMFTIEAKEAEAASSKKKSDIPIPMVSNVESYEREYLPTFQQQNTYIRGRGGVGHRDESFVEYDLDEADWKWLNKFNQGQERLPARRFELLLWRLELANAEANDQQSAMTGAGFPDRISPGVVAQIGNLTKADALQALCRAHALRQHVLSAVYSYWREKRIKRGRPLLRRLQAPTASGDSNPFNVFRPRDKIHRPQTRRRRENNEESLEKMRALRQNLVKAYEVLEWLTRREQRKCHLMYTQLDLQQLLLRLHHEPREEHAAIEAEYRQQAKNKPPQRPLHLDRAVKRPFDTSASPAGTDPTNLSRFKRRKRHRREPAPAIRQLPPPPIVPAPDMLFADAPDVAAIVQHAGQESTHDLSLSTCHRARIGRGGRLIFDRCSAFAREALTSHAAEAEAGRPDTDAGVGEPNGRLLPAQTPVAASGLQ